MRRLSDVADADRRRVLQAFVQQSASAGGAEPLANAAPHLLAQALDRERPQVAAAILHSLSPDRAGEVMGQMCRASRGDLLARISVLEPLDAEVVELLRDTLQSSLATLQQQNTQRAAGQSTVRAILQNLPGAGDWLAAPSEPTGSSTSNAAIGVPSSVGDLPQPNGGPLDRAETKGAGGLKFERLADFSDEVLSAILHVAGESTVSVAMIGADRDLARRIRRLLPAAAEAAQGRPTPLSDIERAQQQLTDCAEQLLQGERPDLSKRFTAAA